MTGYWITLVQENYFTGEDCEITTIRKVYKQEEEQIINGLEITKEEENQLYEKLKESYYQTHITPIGNVEAHYWIGRNTAEHIYLYEEYFELFEIIYTGKLTYYETRVDSIIRCTRIEYSDNLGQKIPIDIETAEIIKEIIEKTKQVLKIVRKSEHINTEEAVRVQQQIQALLISYPEKKVLRDQIFDPKEYFAATEGIERIALGSDKETLNQQNASDIYTYRNSEDDIDGY